VEDRRVYTGGNFSEAFYTLERQGEPVKELLTWKRLGCSLGGELPGGAMTEERYSEVDMCNTLG